MPNYFPILAKGANFPPPATENVNFVHPWHLVTPRNQQLYPWTIMFWLKMLCQYSRRLVATAGNCEFLALLDEEEFSTRQTWCITSFLSQITFTCWGVVDSHDNGELIFYLSSTMFKSNDYLQDRIKEQRKAPEEPHEHRSSLPPTWQCGCEIWRGAMLIPSNNS